MLVSTVTSRCFPAALPRTGFGAMKAYSISDGIPVVEINLASLSAVPSWREKYCRESEKGFSEASAPLLGIAIEIFLVIE